MCYKCGKAGHIASDTSCPQYKKPEQRQIYAAQVVDDRSEGEKSDQKEIAEPQSEMNEVTEEVPIEDIEDCPDSDENPDGPQYKEEESSYEDYDGYATPLDDDEPVYIRAMHEDESGAKTAPVHLEDIEWQPHWEAIQRRYQSAPWMPNDDWEFTPRNGITHKRGCDKCAAYKEHIIVAGVLGNSKSSLAWETRNKYEQDMIRLGWTMAHEGKNVPHNEATAATLGAYNEALEQQNHRLTQQVEALRRLNTQITAQSNELREDLECECLDASLRAGEAALWLDEYWHIQKKYAELENRQLNCLKPTSSLGNTDIEMGSPITGLPARTGSPLITGMGIKEQSETSDPRFDENHRETQLANNNTQAIACIAAARDDPKVYNDHEFRAAHRCTWASGKRPRTAGNDRRCMAALVKVNELEAYALFDSGSTTVSITHDFARVAKLNVRQLENPVALQLRTVGSRSMINYGAMTDIKLGLIHEKDTYVDVVNINRYDMIIGMPFMRKHGIVLDFSKDTLSVQSQLIQTLSSGQEDLMLAKRCKQRASEPTVPSRP
jgi:hypothetical protein